MLLMTTLIMVPAFAPVLTIPNQFRGRMVDDRLLPETLSENETQTVIREGKPKSRVEAVLKVSDLRINDALRSVRESQYQTAADDVDIYAALIRYADHHTRNLPGAQANVRDRCFKRIEQAIFKQSRSLEYVLREMPYGYREAVERAVNDVKRIRLCAIDDLLGGGGLLNSSKDQF